MATYKAIKREYEGDFNAVNTLIPLLSRSILRFSRKIYD